MKTAPLCLLLILQVAAHATVDLGHKTLDTPYSAYMAPVQRVLREGSATVPSMERACELMETARDFRYEFNEPYVPQHPEVTERRGAGDCKDKALWLCDALHDRSARFVIGKVRRDSPLNHAWVLWKKNNRWWILDATNNREPIVAESVARNYYVPLYSFTRNGQFTHADGNRSVVANIRRIRSVAAR